MLFYIIILKLEIQIIDFKNMQLTYKQMFTFIKNIAKSGILSNLINIVLLSYSISHWFLKF